MLRVLALSFGFALVAANSSWAAVYELKVTPQTVVWGRYDALAKPALTVRSGDTVVIHTVLTNSPAGLEKAGGQARRRGAGPPRRLRPRASRRAWSGRPRADRPHLCGGGRARGRAGGADRPDRSGHSLQLQCVPIRGRPPDRRLPRRSHQDRAAGSAQPDRGLRTGRHHSPAPLLRLRRHSAAAGDRPAGLRAAHRPERRQSRQQGAGGGDDALPPGERQGRPAGGRRRPRGAGRRRGGHHGAGGPRWSGA